MICCWNCAIHTCRMQIVQWWFAAFQCRQCRQYWHLHDHDAIQLEFLIHDLGQAGRLLASDRSDPRFFKCWDIARTGMSVNDIRWNMMTYMYVCIYIYTYYHTCSYMYCICKCICICVCLCVCTCMCMYVYVHVCVCMCMYVYVYM